MSEFNALTIDGQSKWSLAAYKYMFNTRLTRKPSLTLQSQAVKTWEISPGDTSIAPPAFFLPNQLERVTGWEEKLFYPHEHPRRTMEGVGRVEHGPTKGYLLKDVWLIDGTLYKGNAKSWLSPGSGWLPKIRVENEIDRVSTARQGMLHTRGYENWLDMRPVYLRNAFFRELVIFDDLCQNRHKHRRFREMGEKLLSHVTVCSHPGVFILRGGTGELRLLRNEMELAERLRDRRGFRILNAATSDVSTIVATCAGARTVIGVEGSQLIHGVNVLPPGGSLLVLQPPNRFICFFKYLTDRDQQNFGFVVGTPEGNGFRIDPDEVERTLDLFPS
jgi:hypothetical protein